MSIRLNEDVTLPWWHQKNDLCYNSRITRYEFQCLLIDYCRGISAKQSSDEFKQERGKKISRQTIAKYFTEISRLVLDARQTYPWWSVGSWYKISDGQMNEIRDAVYNYNNVLSNLRKDFLEETGKSISVDTKTYIKILRDMSKNMNGLPKNNFWVHLGRACEIAYYIDAGFSDPTSAMYEDLLYLFEYQGEFIFRRKTSPTTRAEHAEYLQKRKETEDERIYIWGDFKENESDVAEKKWWNNLDEDEKKHMIKKLKLTVFSNSIQIPHKGTFFRTK